MSNKAAVLIKDPLSKDYSEIFDIVLSKIKADSTFSKSIDICIIEFIADSNELNLALSYIFNLIRARATDIGLDYSFQIDVFFNIPKISELISLNWNKVFISASEIRAIKDVDTKTYTKIDIKESTAINLKSNSNQLPIAYQTFQTTAVGGTFDHIHDGHKILILMTIFVAQKKIIVGITGPELLKNKKYIEVLEKYETRQDKIVQYIRRHIFGSKKSFEVYQINDVCGPTGYIKAIDALTLSSESSKGGEFVNNFRQEKGFPKLRLVSIDVIGGNNSNAENNWKGKLSSTDIREKEIELKKNER